ncbi:hypothetical protein FJQ54_02365 [Sandaracinobacter neustonicus]|uniref:Uncharacterized protein n=1 Tax=Sandaracinobacter neustonicus TaxID=1715348 RepID=A0A501XTG3_9SPHN|nr:hypothetical protein [Sandaracinobacter neustonicus]TPE63719.1 hypothetical protein FJQ54_02365 [Sandaracinobacter neustonicus]
MAFRTFSDTADMDMAAGISARIDAASFTDLEWSVVDIARRDPLSSIQAPGRFAGKMAALLGSRRSLPLADPRLEALRRFAVVDHHLRERLPDSEVAHFVGAGFSMAHVRLLRSSPSLPHSFAI